MLNSLFCPIRKTWVTALPEEQVRQELIRKMTQQLGYPLNSLVLEKSLNQLPHLKFHPALPKRRTDLIVFAKNIRPEYPFYPLLLVECKAISITNKVLRQIIGYNQFVDAPFLAIVNQTHSYFGYYQADKKDYLFHQDFIPYKNLLQMV